MDPIVLPTNDLAFKKLFANAEHPQIIQGFLADILGLRIPTTDIRFENPYSIDSYLEALNDADPETGSLRRPRLRETMRDVTVAIIDTADVTIEMQLARTDHFMARLHYYIDDLYTSNYNRNTPRGKRYSSLKPVISLNILGFDLFDDPRAVHLFSYRDETTGEPLSPQFKRIGFLELGKPATGAVAAWQQFLKTGQTNPSAPNYLSQAARIIAYHNLTNQEKTVVDAAEKAEETSAAILHYAQKEARAEGLAKGLSEGIELGRAEGHEQGLSAVARNLLRHGVPIELVAKYTNLPIADIKKLREIDGSTLGVEAGAAGSV